MSDLPIYSKANTTSVTHEDSQFCHLDSICTISKCGVPRRLFRTTSFARTCLAHPEHTKEIHPVIGPSI